MLATHIGERGLVMVTKHQDRWDAGWQPWGKRVMFDVVAVALSAQDAYWSPTTSKSEKRGPDY